MSWKAQINDRGVITRYRDTDTGESVSAKEFERRSQMAQLQLGTQQPSMTAIPAGTYTMGSGAASAGQSRLGAPMVDGQMTGGGNQMMGGQPQMLGGAQPMAAMPAAAPAPVTSGPNPLIQPGARLLTGNGGTDLLNQQAQSPLPPPSNLGVSPLSSPTQGVNPSAGIPLAPKNLRMEGNPSHVGNSTMGYKNHSFLDATSIAILLPTLVLLALIIAAAHREEIVPLADY